MMSNSSLTNGTNFKKNAEYINTVLSEIKKTFVLNNPNFKDEIFIKLSDDGDIYLMTLTKIIAAIKFNESCGRYQTISVKGYDSLNLDGLEYNIYHLPEKIKEFNNVVWMQ